jgi:hypothetical protein
MNALEQLYIKYNISNCNQYHLLNNICKIQSQEDFKIWVDYGNPNILFDNCINKNLFNKLYKQSKLKNTTIDIILLQYYDKNPMKQNTKIYKKEDDECSICYEKKEYRWYLKCNHSFHFKCINEWLKLKKNCPLCRTQIK